MAKQQKSYNRVVIPGVTNYEKLYNINDKKTSFNKFNPFVSQMYSDKVNRLHEAESLDQRYLDEEIYNQLLMMNGLNQRTRTGAKTSYYGLTRKAKRAQLIRMSIHDIVDEVLTKLTDEIVVTSQDEAALSIDVDAVKLKNSDIDQKFIDELSEYTTEQFLRIQNLMGLNQHGTATSLWNKVYLFLIEGAQAYEVVWDDINNPKKIIGIHEIDAYETEPFFVKGVKYWKHHKSLGYKENYVILYDTQLIYVDWSEASPNNRTSYLEQLVKTFNDLRIIDESTLIWTVTNAMYRMIVKVPTKGKSRIAAAQSLATEKSRLNDDIQYNFETGELNINGSASQIMQKTYYMGEGDSGSPEITTVGQDGYDMSDTSKNDYYSKKFYRAARMPYSRFDSTSAESWNIDVRTQLREEITFGRFVNRIRDIVCMLVLKPLYLQIAAKFPEVKEDPQILDAITLRFNSYSVFEELMKLDILQEKIDAISKINESFTTTTPDGTETKFFSLEFLLNKYLPELTKEDLELNAKMIKAQKERGYEDQIAAFKLAAKYDPQFNVDPETGGVTKEMLARAEDDEQIKRDIADIVDDNDTRTDLQKTGTSSKKDEDKEKQDKIVDDEDDDKENDKSKPAKTGKSAKTDDNEK